LMLPDVSGFTVIDALSHDADTACIPILIVTAMPVTIEVRYALKQHLGASVHVIDQSELNQGRLIAEVKCALLTACAPSA
jgi:CheY-like chemotaxis protein